MRPKVPTLAWTFITEQEGDELTAYWDVDGWAIGRGMHAPDITQNTVWTRETDDMRFGQRLTEIADGICPNIKPELTDQQLSACLSLAWNLRNGVVQFNGSTLLKFINDGQFQDAAAEFPKWDKEKKSDGTAIENKELLARRKKEMALFLSGTEQPEPPATPPQDTPVAPAPAPSGGTVNPIKKIQTARPLTKTLLGIVVILGSALQDPTVQATIAGYASQHKGLAAAIAAIAAIAALMHEPQGKG